MTQSVPLFSVAVVADLVPGGAASATEKLERLPIDRERFDEVLETLSPRLDLRVPDALTEGSPRDVSLRFAAWRDFTPAGLVAQIPELERVRALIERLGKGGVDADTLAAEADGLVPAGWLDAPGEGGAQASEKAARQGTGEPGGKQAAGAPPPAANSSSGDASGVDAILGLVDVGSPQEPAGEQEKARQIVDSLTSRAASAGRGTARAPGHAVEQLQNRLDAQLEAILRDPEFSALERAWTGLRLLVQQTDFREDITMAVVPSSIESASDALATIGEGDDVDVVLAAYEFDASARDFERVQALARAGEAIQSVVLTNLSPSFFACESWDQLGKDESPRTRFAGDAYSAWRSLRDKEESRWLVLVANRIVVRGRYAPDEVSSRGISMTESAPGGLLAPGVWGVGVVLTRSWARTRATVQISGTRNGLIMDLPLRTLGSKPLPVEGSFGNDRREDLESFGITVVQYYQRDVAFVGAVRTFRIAEKFADEDSTADSKQQITLAYQILASRLVKLLSRIVPDIVGTSRPEAEETLRNAVVAHFSRPGKPLRPDHVGVGLEDYPDDPDLTLVRLRVQPEVTIGGRVVNILLNFALGL